MSIKIYYYKTLPELRLSSYDKVCINKHVHICLVTNKILFIINLVRLKCMLNASNFSAIDARNYSEQKMIS